MLPVLPVQGAPLPGTVVRGPGAVVEAGQAQTVARAVTLQVRLVIQPLRAERQAVRQTQGTAPTGIIYSTHRHFILSHSVARVAVARLAALGLQAGTVGMEVLDAAEGEAGIRVRAEPPATAAKAVTESPFSSGCDHDQLRRRNEPVRQLC
ncbi:MAG TPA: hypothetical protein PLT48_01355 [Nitrospira sp.]|nr:hypothetical protein [Nitrospira sp.]